MTTSHDRVLTDDTLGRLYSPDEAARLLGLERTRIKRLDRDNQLVMLRRGGKSWVPARLLELIPEDEAPEELVDAEHPATHRPLWNLRGTITLLRDAGFDSEEIVAWLWADNDELSTIPIVALEEGHHHAVNRVAATLGF